MIISSLILLFCLSFHAYCGDVYRLPKNIYPTRYALTIVILLESNVSPVPYNGTVIIDIKVLENTNKIVLHKRRLHIPENGITVTDSNNNSIRITNVSEDQKKETYTINLEKELEKSKNYILSIVNFRNKLGHRNVGFYLAKYTDANKKRRRLAITDFEPNDAREAFPCFDEPGIKSKFAVRIIRPKDYHSVSNEELVESIDLGNGLVEDIFKETPDMSAYVSAFVVSEHKHTNKVGKQQIFGREDDLERGSMDYSLEVAVKTLKYMEEYTGVEYTLSKLDHFAVPDGYFKDDAMENWGLIIYGESHLMCTHLSAAIDLKRCTSYIAHEIAHQWFGNLVTPEWWDYSWLSESFAAYFQYYIASKVQPEWRLMDIFISESVQNAFLTDDHINYSTPLTYPITRIGQFPPLNILYYKGSTIVRMMSHFLTPEVFQKGLQYYLQDRKYKAATPSDLYKSFQKVVDEFGVEKLLGSHKVATIMNSWETNAGFPIVTAKRNYTTGTITFEQHRLTSETGRHPFIKPWFIPINYVYQSEDLLDFSNTTADFWLYDTQQSLTPTIPLEDWFIINKQQSGFYIVNYDTENWERIINFMNSEQFKSIHVLNRAQLIGDSFHLARTELISYDIPVRLSKYLLQEKDYIPFAAFYNAIDQVHFMDIYETLKNQSFGNKGSLEDPRKLKQVYVQTTLSGIQAHLGFEQKPTDTFLDRLNRAAFTELLCNYNNEECVKFGEQKLKEVVKTKMSTVSPDLEKPLYHAAVGTRKATEEEWEALRYIYDTSTDIYQRRRLRDVLGRHTLSYSKPL